VQGWRKGCADPPGRRSVRSKFTDKSMRDGRMITGCYSRNRISDSRVRALNRSSHVEVWQCQNGLPFIHEFHRQLSNRRMTRQRHDTRAAMPLQRGQRTSRSATRIEASASRASRANLNRPRSPQLSHAITSHGCFAVIAAAILGQYRAAPLAESLALKRRTVASASRSAAHARCIRSTLSRISSFLGRR
jgi:hypothetical protein